MTSYLRVMLGSQSKDANECIQNGFVGTDFDFPVDLSRYLKPTWEASKKNLTALYKKYHPNKSAISVGLNCGSIWTLSESMPIGGFVVSPTGQGDYIYGEISGPYRYVEGSVFPHQREVVWSKERILPENMSQALRKACSLPLTCIDLKPYSKELEGLIRGVDHKPVISVSDQDVESATHFALESILEDFLVSNWKYTEFAKNYNIVSSDGKLVGKQFPVDTGWIDILAVSKDESEYLVIELKRGRASDRVVGQVLRYMGFIQREYCQDGKSVRGAIVANDDDLGIRNALSMVSGVDFYKYSVDFKLLKQDGS